MESAAATLDGRTYWVTGAGTGFGRAIAVALASAGAEVFVTGRRLSRLQETVDDVGAAGVPARRCHTVPADITSAKDVARATAYIRAQCGSLTGLVSCAAVPQRGGNPWPLQEEDGDYFDAVMKTNVGGQLRIARAILPHMLAGGGARMLFLTSAAGWSFAPGFGHYNVSKAALNSVSACLAAECAARYPDHDIQINALDPGQARTEMNGGSDVSPETVVPMAMRLLTQPRGGPNGRFFRASGESIGFGIAAPYPGTLA